MQHVSRTQIINQSTLIKQFGAWHRPTTVAAIQRSNEFTLKRAQLLTNIILHTFLGRTKNERNLDVFWLYIENTIAVDDRNHKTIII